MSFSAGLTRAWDYNQPPATWRTWRRISEADYWYCLEVLPPIYLPTTRTYGYQNAAADAPTRPIRGFAVGEAVTERDGETIYLCVTKRAGRAYARLASLREASEELAA